MSVLIMDQQQLSGLAVHIYNNLSTPSSLVIHPGLMQRTFRVIIHPSLTSKRDAFRCLEEHRNILNQRQRELGVAAVACAREPQTDWGVSPRLSALAQDLRTTRHRS